MTKLHIVVNTTENCEDNISSGSCSVGSSRVLTGISLTEIGAEQLIFKDYMEMMNVNNLSPLRNPLIPEEIGYSVKIHSNDGNLSSTNNLFWQIAEVDVDEILNFTF